MKIKTVYKVRLVYAQAWLVGWTVPMIMGFITEPETLFHIGLFLLTSIAIGCLYGEISGKWLYNIRLKESKENNGNK